MRKEYRSATRSKNLIRTAFLELIDEKEPDKITVTDIVKRADINRSTFYAHYPDVRGLREAIEDEIIRQTFSLMPQDSHVGVLRDPVAFLMEMNKLVTRNMYLYKILSKKEYAQELERKMKKVFIEEVRISEELVREFGDPHIVDIRIRFFISGMISVYQQWFQGDLDCSLEEIARDLGRIIWLSGQDVPEK